MVVVSVLAVSSARVSGAGLEARAELNLPIGDRQGILIRLLRLLVLRRRPIVLLGVFLVHGLVLPFAHRARANSAYMTLMRRSSPVPTAGTALRLSRRLADSLGKTASVELVVR